MRERTPVERREGCLSRLAFDRLLADERTGREAALLHLEACASCRDRLESLRAEQSARVGELAVERGVERLMVAAAERRGSRPGWLRPILWMPLVSTAMAAAIVLVVVRAPRRPSADLVHLKGAPVFQVLVAEKGGARPLGEDDRLRPGDTLAFRVAVERESFVLLAGIAETGPAYLIDADGKAPWRTAPGPLRPLPVHAELDRQPGDERLVAFFCQRRPEPSEALRHVDESYPRGAGRGRDLRPAAFRPTKSASLAGCVTRTVLVHRAALP